MSGHKQSRRRGREEREARGFGDPWGGCDVCETGWVAAVSWTQGMRCLAGNGSLELWG